MSDPMLDAFDEPSGQQEPFKASSNNEGYKGKFLTNPLSEHPTSTYYARLSLVHPSAAKSLNPANNEKLIVAETATTSRFYIEDLQIAQTVSWNGETRSTPGAIINFTIKETFGVSLMDYLIRGCQDLDIKNHLTAPYLLEVEFRHEIANQPDDYVPYYFVYPLVFDNGMQISINESGATYMIRANMLSTVALKHLSADITSGFELQAKNLGEALDALQDALNNAKLDEKNADSAEIKDQYNIILKNKKWRSFKFDNLSDPEVNPMHGQSLAPGNKLYLSFAKGSNVPDMINAILAKCVEIEKLPTLDGTPAIESHEEGKAKGDLGSLKTFYTIKTLTEYLGFDNKRNDYAKKYTYSINTNTIQPELYDLEELLQGLNDKTAVSKRVRALVNEQLLKKRYDYYYTGVNTEVLRFDVTLNNTWHQIRPIRNGAQDSRLSIKGRKFSGDPVKNTEAGEDFLQKGKGKLFDTTFGTIPEQVGTAELLSALDSETSPNLRSQNNIFLEWYGTAEQKDDIKYYPVRQQGGVIPNEIMFGATPGKSSGLAKFGAVYANLTNTNDLLNIDIEIKGDPFWLGLSNLSKKYRGSAAKGLAKFAMYDKGSNMFWLNINTPNEPDKITGQMSFEDVPSISGIYVVDKVISSFSGGMFTQNLTARRDTGTNYRFVKAELQKGTDSYREEDNKPSKEKVEYTDDELTEEGFANF